MKHLNTILLAGALALGSTVAFAQSNIGASTNTKANAGVNNTSAGVSAGTSTNAKTSSSGSAMDKNKKDNMQTTGSATGGVNVNGNAKMKK